METRRITTVRATYVVVVAALAAGGVIALMIALLAPPDTTLAPARTSAALTAGGDSVPMSVVGALVALLGVVTVGHDYRFGLLRAVLAAQPRRGVAVAARMIVLALASALTAAGVSVIGASVCWLLGRVPAHDPTTLRVLGTHVVVSVLWAWLGAGLGWVLRSTAGAVSLLLLGPLLVEPVLSVLADAGGGGGGTVGSSVLRWLPFAAGRQALGRQLWSDADTVGALAGGAVFGGATLVVVALAWLLVVRRDA
jgi:ABC-2 type transport system permease protein